MRDWTGPVVFWGVVLLAVALFIFGAEMSGPPTVPWPEHPSLGLTVTTRND